MEKTINNLQPVYFMSAFKVKIHFKILLRLYISIIIEQLTNKIQALRQEKKKNVQA